MTLRCLFVDFDSYFASVEQYDRPELRGRPVGVVPVEAETTCCLAASYEAKAHDVKTGTSVRQARERCPDITLLLARPARYIEIHKRLMDAIEDCIPHGKPMSIDEVPCTLIGAERQRDNAKAIALRIKQRLIDLQLSPAINCSIGIAPNRFLAKTASDMDKPNGLTIIEQTDLPQALHRLALRDFCGIGPSMEKRLNAAGIFTAEQLCNASREHLRIAWGSIEGERYWLQLRGIDLAERPTNRGSIGHSHVLGPELRSFEGMRAVLCKLLAKAAMRLRKEQYLATGMAIRVRFVGWEKRFERDLHFCAMDETTTLLDLLGKQLEAMRKAIETGRWNAHRHPPLSVAVTLIGLQPAGALTADLLDPRQHAASMNKLLDKINQRYGNNAIYFGSMQQALNQNAAPMRIPFSTIPDTASEEDIHANSRQVIKQPIDLTQHTDSYELWLARERQFKVLAETTHRQQQEKSRKPHAPAGAGGWTKKKSKTSTPTDTKSLPPQPPHNYELF